MHMHNAYDEGINYYGVIINNEEINYDVMINNEQQSIVILS